MMDEATEKYLAMQKEAFAWAENIVDAIARDGLDRCRDTIRSAYIDLYMARHILAEKGYKGDLHNVNVSAMMVPPKLHQPLITACEGLLAALHYIGETENPHVYPAVKTARAVIKLAKS